MSVKKYALYVIQRRTNITRYPKVLYALVFMVCSLLLIACGVQETTTAPANPTQAAPQPTTSSQDAPKPTAPSQDAPQGNGDVLIVFNQSGGFAGINDTFTVKNDGTLELVHERPPSTAKGQASPQQLQALQTLLNDPAFAALQPKYGNAVPDGFVYTLTVNGKSVVTNDGSDAPEIVGEVLNVLGEMKAGVK